MLETKKRQQLAPKLMHFVLDSGFAEDRTQQSPGNSCDACHRIEVAVAADERLRVLSAQGRNPNIVGRNRSTSFSELVAHPAIGDRSPLIDVEDQKFR